MANHGQTFGAVARRALLLGAVSLTTSCELFKAGGGLMMETLQPRTHLLVPFDAGTKGATAEVELRVPRRASYGFRLEYLYRTGDRAAEMRVRSLTQGPNLHGVSFDRENRPIDAGLMVPVRVRVLREGTESPQLAYDAVLTHQRVRGAGASPVEGYGSVGKDFTNAYAVLDPGRYRVRVEALEDVPALRGIPVQFWLHGGGWSAGTPPARSAP